MNYFSKLFSTGAIRETPKKVVGILLQQAGTSQIDTIVEVGAGKGELTQVLLKNNLPLHYYAFEIDETACKSLKAKFPEIILRRQDAFDFNNQIAHNEKVGLFLSSIPLSFYSKSKINQLLTQAKNTLETDGKIIIIFSAFWLIPILKRQLLGGRLYSFFTFPPYFLLTYQKPKED
jgi:phospholipid N-methyltransferase